MRNLFERSENAFGGLNAEGASRPPFIGAAASRMVRRTIPPRARGERNEKRRERSEPALGDMRLQRER